MNEYLENAENELKRVDHLVYVSLKYTRTVDVIRSAIERMIAAFDFSFHAIFEKVKKRRKNFEAPGQPRKICEVLKGLFKDDKKLIDYLDFYLLLRDLSQAKFDRREEYRRHVTMISHLDNEKAYEVNIDILYEFYDRMNQYIAYLKEEVL
jgi:hypothetical protein